LFWFIPPLYSFYALFAFVFTSGIFTSCLTKLFVYALFSTTIRKLLAVKQTFFHSRCYFDLIALIWLLVFLELLVLSLICRYILCFIGTLRLTEDKMWPIRYFVLENAAVFIFLKIKQTSPDQINKDSFIFLCSLSNFEFSILYLTLKYLYCCRIQRVCAELIVQLKLRKYKNHLLLRLLISIDLNLSLEFLIILKLLSLN